MMFSTWLVLRVWSCFRLYPLSQICFSDLHSNQEWLIHSGWLSIALRSKSCHLRRKKSYHEMFNFENWFFCQFSSNTRFSFGGGSRNTPKIGKRKKEFTNINLRGFKTQKTWRGCFSRKKRVSKFSFFIYAMIFAFITCVKNAPLWAKNASKV